MLKRCDVMLGPPISAGLARASGKVWCSAPLEQTGGDEISEIAGMRQGLQSHKDGHPIKRSIDTGTADSNTGM